MKEYDLISIGTGSAMSIVDIMIEENPKIKVAVVDKDEPGGICLTRGCIPSKILLYSAELVRTIERAHEFGIDVDIRRINFEAVMQRMRTIIQNDINTILQGLSNSKNIDYYPATAEFVEPYTIKIKDDIIKSKKIFLCTGSAPIIPEIKGLHQTRYHTSDTILKMTQLPGSVSIIGGGYIAAEYGHFFSAMGSKVTIIGRNPQFLPEEEPEVSALAKKALSKHIAILTNHEVQEVEEDSKTKRLSAVDRNSGEMMTIEAEEIVIASGRGPNTGLLHPEKAGIQTDTRGWILVNDFLETSQPNVWAFGDANGRYPFKHKANYEAQVVYHNAIMGRGMKADYHAVPHAVFTDPEIASVGLGEIEAVREQGKDNVLIGIERYEDTAKGEAIRAKDYFVKIILQKDTLRILGAHIFGPNASILIQEIINLMYTQSQSVRPIIEAMHIHPALSEVVQGACYSTMPTEQYHHVIEHHFGFPTN